MDGAGRPAGRHGGVPLRGRHPAKLGQSVPHPQRRHSAANPGEPPGRQPGQFLVAPERRHGGTPLREPRAQMVSGKEGAGGRLHHHRRPGDCERAASRLAQRHQPALRGRSTLHCPPPLGRHRGIGDGRWHAAVQTHRRNSLGKRPAAFHPVVDCPGAAYRGPGASSGVPSHALHPGRHRAAAGLCPHRHVPVRTRTQRLHPAVFSPAVRRRFPVLLAGRRPAGEPGHHAAGAGCVSGPMDPPQGPQGKAPSGAARGARSGPGPYDRGHLHVHAPDFPQHYRQLQHQPGAI